MTGPWAVSIRSQKPRSDRWETSSTQPRASHARTTSRPNRVSPPPASGSRQPSASSFRWFQVRPRARTPSRWKISTLPRLPWRLSPPSDGEEPPHHPRSRYQPVQLLAGADGPEPPGGAVHRLPERGHLAERVGQVSGSTSLPGGPEGEDLEGDARLQEPGEIHVALA